MREKLLYFSSTQCPDYDVLPEVLSSLSDACPTLKYNFEVFEVGDLSRYQGGESCGGATQGVKFIRSGDSEIKISSPQSEGGEEEYAPLMNWKSFN